MSAAYRFLAKIVATQLLVGIVVAFAVASFAPRLLLLSEDVVSASLSMVVWACSFVLGGTLALTIALVRRLRPTLRALILGSMAVDIEALHAIHRLPLRLVRTFVLLSFFVGIASIFRPLRPIENDVSTQIALVFLAFTMVTTAALPLYAMLRAQASHVLELAPVAVAKEANEKIAKLETRAWSRHVTPK